MTRMRYAACAVVTLSIGTGVILGLHLGNRLMPTTESETISNRTSTIFELFKQWSAAKSAQELEINPNSTDDANSKLRGKPEGVTGPRHVPLRASILGHSFNVRDWSPGNLLLEESYNDQKEYVEAHDTQTFSLRDYMSTVIPLDRVRSVAILDKLETMTDVRKLKATSAGAGIGLEGIFHIGFNQEARKMDRELSQSDTVLYQAESTVQVAEVRLESYPGRYMRPDVANALAALPKLFNASDPTNVAAFESFERIHNLWIVSSVVVGGKISADCFIHDHSSLRSSLSQSEVVNGLRGILGNWSFGFGQSRGTEIARLATTVKNHVTHETRKVGGDITKDFMHKSPDLWTQAQTAEWVDDVQREPQVIQPKIKDIGVLTSDDDKKRAIRAFIAHQYGLLDAPPTQANVVTGLRIDHYNCVPHTVIIQRNDRVNRRRTECATPGGTGHIVDADFSDLLEDISIRGFGAWMGRTQPAVRVPEPTWGGAKPVKIELMCCRERIVWG